MSAPRRVLVTGATGGQGGSVATELLKRGVRVRAFVLDLEDRAARALAAAGAELVRGDFADVASIEAALIDVNGVFSMQPDGAPVAQFHAFVAASVAAGVEHFVHSSVSGVRDQERILDRLDGDVKQDYWQAKVAQERLVRAAPFRFRTYLRPSLILDNLILRAPFMYPRLATHGELLVAMTPDQRVSFVSYDTIGRAAAAAFADPERFAGAELELADTFISHAELAAALAEISGRPVTVISVEESEAIAMGLAPRVAHSHRWLTDAGYPARPGMLARYGIEPRPVREWLRCHAGQIVIGRR